MRNLIIPILIVLLASCKPINLIRQYNFSKKGVASQNNQPSQIPFIEKGNLVIIKVTLNGKDYDFVFDTGAELSLITKELAEAVQVKKNNLKASALDAIGKNHKSNTYLLNNLKVGEQVFNNMPFIESNLNTLSKYAGVKLYGIIGNQFMKNMVWGFNFTTKTVCISHKFAMQAQQVFTDSIPFETTKTKKSPQIFYKLPGSTKEHYVIFDMGSNGALNLGKRFYKAEHGNKKYDSFKTNSNSFGFAGNSTNIDSVFVFNNASITLGSLVLIDQNINYDKVSPATLGMLIIKQYNIVIDWTSNKIYLNKV